MGQCIVNCRHISRVTFVKSMEVFVEFRQQIKVTDNVASGLFNYKSLCFEVVFSKGISIASVYLIDEFRQHAGIGVDA